MRRANSRRQEGPGPQRRASLLAGAAFLVLGTLLVYIPAIRSGYIWDDDAYVYKNPTLTAPHALSRIWFDRTASPQYYPLVFTTFYLEHRLWGMHPLGYHVVNALLHGLAALLFWRLLHRLAVPGAFLAGCLFAFHPVQVESVAWITERKNLLSGFCYLGSASLFLRFVRHSGRDASRRVRLYAASFLVFLGALFAKTTAASLPAALLLVLVWKERRVTRSQLLATLPFFVAGIALGLQTAWLEKHQVGASGYEWSLSAGERLIIAGHAILFYLQKLFLPVNLTFMYPRWEMGPAAIRQLPYLLGVALLAVGLYLARRRVGTGPLVALLFFVGTLFPALGFFDVYPMRYSFVADHFQYLATLGPFAVLAAGIAIARDRILGRPAAGDPPAETTRAAGEGPGRHRFVRHAPFALILALLAGLTWHQQKDYRDVETLWRRTLLKNPRAWISHVNLGIMLVDRKEYEAALDHFLQAIQIRPEEYNGFFNAGSVLNTLRRYDEAIPYLERAAILFPEYPDTQYALGLARLRTHRPGAAVVPFSTAVDLRPEWAEPLNGLAWVLSVYPDSAFSNPAAGVQFAERAVAATAGRDPHLLDTAAAAYAASGRFDRALEALERARTLFAAAGDSVSLASLEQTRRLYASGRPYREAVPSDR